MEKLNLVLPPPDLPQMSSNFTISESNIEVGGGVFVRILPYTNAAKGDYITVIWNGTRVREFLLEDITSAFPIVSIISTEVEQGEYQIAYSVEDKAGNVLSSEPITLQIIHGQSDVIYSAPEFIDAANGVIDEDSINDNDGTDILVRPYENMSINDYVTLFWIAYNENGEQVNSIIETSGVTIDNLVNGVVFHVEGDEFTNLYGGECTAFYQVRTSSVILGISDKTEVSLSKNNNSPAELDMIITTGAVIYDTDTIAVHPFNQGVLKGRPGVEVLLTLVGEGAVFDESGNKLYTTRLDENGRATFKVRSQKTGGCIVTAYEKEHPEISVRRDFLFGQYEKGIGKIEYLNVTTGAPTDGVTPCSIYLKTATSLRDIITTVRVNITGNAIIDGYETNPADIILHSDNSAEINIVSTQSGEVEVELSLPESSGSINRKSIAFVDF